MGGDHIKYDVSPQYLANYPYYSRHGQDKFLNEKIFKNKQHGIFVDLGAYDGVESSNTLFFEESLKWNGICVEPLPKAFEKLKKNRNCLCINKCALGSDGIYSFMHVNPKICPPSPREPGRTSNYEKMSGLVNFYDPKHRKIIDDVVSKYGGNKTILKIECENINSILKQLNSNYIDLFSIDTEGSELDILKQINFEKFNIKAIVTEVLYHENDILNFMKEVKYKKIGEIGYDWIFEKV